MSIVEARNRSIDSDTVTTSAAPRATTRISMRQAKSLIEALAFAREIGAPLNAHATIHWVGTQIGDDPDGRLFAKPLKLTFPHNPDALYLVKGGGPDVWRRFQLPKKWRKPQGVIFGKRCGTTENIGPAARRRAKDRRIKKG
jgi:hypothetical protein